MKALLALSLKVKIIIAACIAAVAAAVTVVVVMVNSEDSYRVIKVFEIEGQAVVTRDKTGELEAYQGMNLESGDVLSVGSGSFLRLSLDGDKYILLDSGTVLELIATGSAADSRTVIDLKEGSILNEITNALSANSSYTVNTPKATMAVRGTSFRVTVERTQENGYITNVDTVHGRVLVTLYDESGNEIKAEAEVTEGNGVIILTDPNGETGNAAEVDGNAYFALKEADGSYVPCPEGDPVHPSDYGTFSEVMRNVALNSNDSRLLLLDSRIVERLRGTGSETEKTTETTASETVTEETSADSETPTSHESTADTTLSAVFADEPYVTAAPEPLALDIPAVTTAPAVNEDMPVYPSEFTSAAVTAPAETEEVTAAETTVTARTDTETFVTTASVTTKTTTEKTTTAKTTTVTTAASVPSPNRSTPTAPVTTAPIVTPTGTTTGTTAETTTETTTETATSTTTETTTETTVETTTETTAETTTETTTETTAETTETTAEIISHLVQFINGSDITELELEDGKPLGTLPVIPARTGHTAKWVSGGTEVTAETVVTGDMEITAEYTPIGYTLTFTADGTTVNTYERDYGTAAGTLPEIPEKTGYTAKWVYGSDEVTAATVVTGDMEITAEYTPIGYTLTFTADGTTVNTYERDYGTAAGTLPEIPEKTGYTAKWVCGGTEVTAEMVVTGDMDITAVYTPIKYTVKFSDGMVDTENEIDYGEALGTLPAITPKTGHTAKWVCGGTEITAEMVVTGDMEITAEYTPIKYTLTFTIDGTTVDTLKIEYGTAAGTLPEIPEKTGYEKKWVCGGDEVKAETVVTEDMEITAEYTPKKVEIRINAPTPTVADTYDTVYTFEADYDSTVSKDTIDSYIAQLDNEYSVAQTNYKNRSVTLTDGLGEDASNGFSVSGNNVSDISGSPYVTVSFNYAKYFTVTFKDENGQTLNQYEVYDNETIGTCCSSLPDIDEKTGYTAKWFCSGSEVTLDTIPLQDMTVTPQYTVQTVEIRAYTVGASTKLAKTYTGYYYGDTVTKSTLQTDIDSIYSSDLGTSVTADYVVYDSISSTDNVPDSFTLEGDHIKTDATTEALYIDIYFIYATVA